MAIAEAFTGTETVTATEWSLTTDSAGPDEETDDGTYCAVIDLSALAAGDSFEFKVYEKAIGGGTQRLLDSRTFTGAQGVPLFLSIWYPLLHGWDMTLKKIAGTDRAITWSIRKYG